MTRLLIFILRQEGKLQELFDWNTVEDLGDLLLTPTFTNAHTHLCMVGFRGIGGQSLQGNVVENLYFHLESHMEPKDVQAFCRIGALEALMSGTGFCWDHYYHALHNAQAFIDVGLCGGIAPTLQDISVQGKPCWTKPGNIHLIYTEIQNTSKRNRSCLRSPCDRYCIRFTLETHFGNGLGLTNTHT